MICITNTTKNIERRIEAALLRREVITEKELDKIEIRECGEPLVQIDIRKGKVLIQMSAVRKNFEIEEGRFDNILYVRKTIARMLNIVENSLPLGYQLVIFDAFRPVEYQAKRFKERFDKFKQEYPLKSEQEIRELTYVYIFPPNMDLKKPSPHSTGGALDLTLAYQGKLVDMGTDYGNYDKNRDLIQTNSELITGVQKENRRFFIKAMLNAGFANYPGEWWHFMYGDREWVAYEKLDTTARYGRASFDMVIE